MNYLRRFGENAVIFLLGGIIYSLLEILFRGGTHWTMTLTGGMCLLLIYRHCANSPEEGMFGKCFYGMTVITAFELAVGCIVNLIFHMGVWDYSSLPFNLFGQICLMFSALWFLLSAPAVWLCRAVERVFQEANNSYEYKH
jgi:uncharacterized membrane protein